MDKEEIKNLLSKINDELDVLARLLNQESLIYIVKTKNLEMKTDQQGKNYKEIKLEIELIERIG